MTSPPSDASATTLSRVLDELKALRGSVESMETRLATLVGENAELRRQLEHSESSRNDLLAQTEHLVDLLDTSRRELQKARGQPDS